MRGMKTWSWRMSVATICVIASTLGANANGRVVRENDPHACKENRKEFCPQSEAGKAGSCLRQHMAHLTSACQAKIRAKSQK
jgi:hypothetical protein